MIRYICDGMAISYLFLGAWKDIREREIPLALMIPFGGGAVISGYIRSQNNMTIFILGLLPGILMILISFLSSQSIGYGDGISTMIIGMLCGLQNCLFILAASLLCAALLALVLLTLKKAGKNFQIPYLPFLLFGYILMMAVK